MSAFPKQRQRPTSARSIATVLASAIFIAGCADSTGPIAPDLGARPVSLEHSRTPVTSTTLPAPLFELSVAPDGSILAAVASSGVFAIGANKTDLVVQLPGANGVASIGSGELLVTTGGSTDPSQIFPTSRKLFRASAGAVREVADLWAYEQAANPDQVWNTGPVPVESNPFDVTVLNGGRALVADAAANDILMVEANGTVDWVAVLTPISAGGPQPVPTSIAIGPDGGYYVGELTGFPATPGLSRVWRIEPGSRHVLCPSTACSLVASGFTSIMDLAFGLDGTLYVVEFDEASWLGVEGNGFVKTPAGGTVNACNVITGSCSVTASGLSLPTAITVSRDGAVWVAEHAPMLFAASQVRRLQ